MKLLLARLDIDPVRLEMFNLSAAMGPRWAQICTEFVEKMRALGPAPIHAATLNKKCS